MSDKNENYRRLPKFVSKIIKLSQNHIIHAKSTDMRGNRNYMTSVQDGICIKQGFKQTFQRKTTARRERDICQCSDNPNLLYSYR